MTAPSTDAIAQAHALIDDSQFKHWAASVLARAEVVSE